MTTIHERVAAARQQLREAGISLGEADLGARLLAEHILGWDAAQFFTSANGQEPDGFQAAYERLVGRRVGASRSPTSPAARNSGISRSRCRPPSSFLDPRPS